MKRSKHSLSHYNLHTFDMGQLIPIDWFEALPGDSVRMSSSALLRLSPLATPVMHPVQVRIHHWFVPNRVMWDGWENFITGVDTEDPPPFMEWVPTPKSLPDYMGIGPYDPGTGVTHSFSLFPLIAYNKIYNEFYRDQDLIAEVADDNTVVRNIAWEKDYFTAARPFAQQGDPVTLSLGTRADVRGIGIRQGDAFTNAGEEVIESSGDVFEYAASQDTQDGTNIFEIEENPDIPGAPNIWADLTTATGVDVNQIRLLFALQRYKEARAQYGSRYTEYLRYLGVRSSDARLQRPEYLGGGKSTVSFSEVLRTGGSEGEGQPLGEMAGHGIAAVKSRRWVKFFEEHGIVMTLASIRPRSMYTNGIHRSWSRETKEDYWQKELELIGQQSVLRKEVYAADATAGQHFGYQDRYSEYRHLPSYVTSEFRTTLNDWHMGRIFGSAPSLNGDFVNCVPSKRVFAEQTQNSIWGMFSHHIQARRLVGKRTIGRII